MIESSARAFERVYMQNVDAEGLEGTGRVWEPSVDERSTGCSSEESRTGRSSTAEAEDTSLTLLLVSSLQLHPYTVQSSCPCVCKLHPTRKKEPCKSRLSLISAAGKD